MVAQGSRPAPFRTSNASRYFREFFIRPRSGAVLEHTPSSAKLCEGVIARVDGSGVAERDYLVIGPAVVGHLPVRNASYLRGMSKLSCKRFLLEWAFVSVSSWP